MIHNFKSFSAFKDGDFYSALHSFFATDLRVPLHVVPKSPLSLEDVLGQHYSAQSEGHKAASETYFLGLVDDMAFAGAKNTRSLDQLQAIPRQYQGIALFGIVLGEEKPKRAHFTDIIRSLNRSFLEMPVMVIFKHGQKISLAAIERQTYKQAWRPGEKMGKVFLLQDIDVDTPHAGHVRILNQLRIPQSGKDSVQNYEQLYAYWQRVLNVSLLNEQFYRELQAWFFWAVEQVEFPDGVESDRDKRNAVNVIRLITRLIFVWFLKERKLVPDVLFDRTTLENELNWKDKTGSTYYKAILQNLFFATLNTQMDRDMDNPGKDSQRVWVKRQSGVQGYYRYERFFRNPASALSHFRNIPFLNGGLFENLDREVGTPQEIRVDCFSNRLDKEELLKFPDELFFGETIEVDQSAYFDLKKGKKRLEKVRGLIHILNDYKFTITENTPLDQEVALDPELLGKVFENLLAAYNPETKTSARNQTGSFYTPREIVDFMVDESLLAHIQQRLDKSKIERPDQLEADLRALLQFGTEQPFSSLVEKEAIISCLNDCKILDPACGSGAFPMGILQKMVHVLAKLDPDNALWKAAQIAKARKELQADLELAAELNDGEIRSRAETELKEKEKNIDRYFDEQENELGFARKLFLIENCIYGVDIQPVAVQIAKLRFFISLLVDQKVNDDRENLGIIPLPNLETKFVAADTLIKLPLSQQKTLRNKEIEALEVKLTSLRHQYFTARTPAAKRSHREKDHQLRARIAHLMRFEGWGEKVADKLAKWDMFDQNKPADFFHPEWMFGIHDPEQGGEFDIVIGNPPYVQIQSFSGKDVQKKWEEMNYLTFSKTGDIYSLFYERGVQLLRKNGILVYITSNRWMRAGYGEKTREFFTKHANPLALLDFGMSLVFDSATMLTNILILQKAPNQAKTKTCRIDGKYTLSTSLSTYFEANHSLVSDLGKEAWVAYLPIEYQIIQHVRKKGIPLNHSHVWTNTINRGILTGYNPAFIIDETTKNTLVAADPKNAEIIKPILRGRDVRRWYPDFGNLWLAFIPWHFPLQDDSSITGSSSKAEQKFASDFPIMFNHLKGHFKALSARNKAETGIRYEWYCLQRWGANYYRDFEKPKIIYPNMTKFMPFCYDEVDHFFCNDKAFIVTGDHLKYLTAIFNSSLFFFCFKDNFPELLGDTYEVRKVFLEKIPIKVPTRDEETPLERMTEYLSFLHRNGTQDGEAQVMAGYFDRLADALVYELYYREKFEATGKTLREHLGDLPPIQDMRDTAYFEIIRKVYTRLSDLNHRATHVISTMAEIPEIALMEETNKKRLYDTDYETDD